MKGLLDRQVLFFGGKGGVGKTTCAAAMALAASRVGKRVLLVSTDPAHSTSDIFERTIGPEPVELQHGTVGARDRRRHRVGALRRRSKERVGVLFGHSILKEAFKQIDLAASMPGAEEVALFDRMGRLILGEDPRFDLVIFDTAPTGHTLRLIRMPELMEAWVRALTRSRRAMLASRATTRRIRSCSRWRRGFERLHRSAHDCRRTHDGVRARADSRAAADRGDGAGAGAARRDRRARRRARGESRAARRPPPTPSSRRAASRSESISTRSRAASAIGRASSCRSFPRTSTDWRASPHRRGAARRHRSACMTISKPQPGDYALPFQTYVDDAAARGDDALAILEGQESLLDAMASWPEAKAGHRYADGKWSVREVVGHMADAERIFAYRLLRIGRGDATPLPGFDENAYQLTSGFEQRTLASVVAELRAVRTPRCRWSAPSTPRPWTARARPATSGRRCAAMAWVVAGHFQHHANILTKRYGM